jgi:hypothetical protein
LGRLETASFPNSIVVVQLSVRWLGLNAQTLDQFGKSANTTTNLEYNECQIKARELVYFPIRCFIGRL